MLTGKQFKLKRPTVCVERLDGHRKAVTLPAGAIIKVLSGSMGDGDRMVEVLWEGRTLAMFAVDVNVRGSEIKEYGAKA
jgi:hypothetical protein